MASISEPLSHPWAKKTCSLPLLRAPFSEWVCGVLATWLPPCVWGQGSGSRDQGRDLSAPCTPASPLCDQTCLGTLPPSPCSASLTPGKFSPNFQARLTQGHGSAGSRHDHPCSLRPGRARGVRRPPPATPGAEHSHLPGVQECRRGEHSAPSSSGHTCLCSLAPGLSTSCPLGLHWPLLLAPVGRQ